MGNDTFYITTPIYYPSAKLHIGNAYSTVLADTAARYKKMRGVDTFFLTGSDEHGMKIQRAAEAAGMTPKQYVDEIVEGPGGFKNLWQALLIDYDKFIRTTDDYHVKAVQKLFQIIYEKATSTNLPTAATTAQAAKPFSPTCSWSTVTTARTAARKQRYSRKKAISSR